ncbi:MAG: hypothetical protein Q7T01_03430 [bacterium]|nr:hypothetical protein [bacterium]
MYFVQTYGHRTSVPSLATFLRRSLTQGARMNATIMQAHDVAECRWLGYGIGKGVTDPNAGITVFSPGSGPETQGLHGELIQGFPFVDPTPLCYEDTHVFGFGTFLRWVYFADPQGGPGVLGVDFSLTERQTAGVATSMLAVARCAAALAGSGIPPDAELVLLNWRMCEPVRLTALRHTEQLITLRDWARAVPHFASGGTHCPRCGLHTLHAWVPFCNQCGCRPALVWKRNGIAPHINKEVPHGMEERLAGLRRITRPVPSTACAA